MDQVATLLDDIDASLGRGVGGDRALSQITDLFLQHGAEHGPERVAIFDEVMQRFARVVTVDARAQLAHRLVHARQQPPKLVRSLAHDEIAVAAPILSRSVALDEQDLMAIALVKGRDHLLALCARPNLPEPVTDLLVSRGDSAVNQAALGNSGARFSALGFAALIQQSTFDAQLQEMLGERRDLTDGQTRALIAATKDGARRRLSGKLAAGKDTESGARPAPGDGAHNEMAWAAIARLAETGFLDEAQLANFAREGRMSETVATLVRLTELPAEYIGTLLQQRDNDILLVLARSKGWSWETAQALLQLRDPSLKSPHQFWHASEIFRTMPYSTAQQAVEFIRARHRAPVAVAEQPRRRWLKSG